MGLRINPDDAKRLVEQIMTMTRCPGCTNPIDDASMFCMFCGNRNQNFGIGAIHREGITGIDELMKGCDFPHRQPDGPDERFCLNCGYEYPNR
jgi:hypothetical protein